MSRSTTLAIVHPVDKLQGSDDAVRTQVWAETTHLLNPMLGKLYARFEPAQKAWRQATYTPLGVVLGRTDPALFLYFFSYGKTVQKESMEFHLSGLMNSLAVDQKVNNGNIHSLVMSLRENSEEAAVGLTDIVPFLIEDMLTSRGGRYSKKDDWQPYAITDGNLVTGQNPASSEEAARAVLKLLGAQNTQE